MGDERDAQLSGCRVDPAQGQTCDAIIPTALLCIRLVLIDSV
jgi:hypothetical protein